MQLTEAEARLKQILEADAHWAQVDRLGLAVSGGGDSMALLHLLAEIAPARGIALEAATIDHGLRAEATDEARFVAETCAALGIPHTTLAWNGWDGQGNLQAAARAARYRLLGNWARERGIDTVALAHTGDDVAETFLMRLAREAGLDGLSAMAGLFEREGVLFWRPCLGLKRADLRAFLSGRDLEWREDPSNEDSRFDRVKAREALAALAGLGLDAGKLQQVAHNLGASRAMLERYTAELAARAARVEAGDVLIDLAVLPKAGDESLRRLLSAALVWVAGADYAPRRTALAELIGAIAAGRPHSLHGCLVAPGAGQVRIMREFNAVRGLQVATDALWDGRWKMHGPHAPDLRTSALGDAVSECPWRETGLPRASLKASPAIWRGEELVAAPVAGLSNGWNSALAPSRGNFDAFLLSRVALSH